MQTSALRSAPRQLSERRRSPATRNDFANAARFSKRTLRMHYPNLRIGDSLFPEFDSHDFAAIEHRGYARLLRELRALQNRLFDCTKFDKLLRYRCANLFFLVLPNELFRDSEIPIGWGALVESERCTRCSRANRPGMKPQPRIRLAFCTGSPRRDPSAKSRAGNHVRRHCAGTRSACPPYDLVRLDDRRIDAHVGSRLLYRHEQIVPGHLFRLWHSKQKQKSRCDVGQNSVFAAKLVRIFGHVNEMHQIGGVRRVR